MLRRLLGLGVFSFVAVLVRAEPTAKPVDLFEGRDLAGWTLVAAESTDLKASCSVKPDGVVAVTGNPRGYLLTDAAYENFELHLEYRWPANAADFSNSGVLFPVVGGPAAPSPWPKCIQVQIKLQKAGDLLQMFGAQFAEPVTSPAKGDMPPLRARQEPSSEKPLGEWNALDVVCRGGAMEVRVNGVLQNRVTGLEPRVGRIGIQLECTPYELRQVRLTSLAAR